MSIMQLSFVTTPLLQTVGKVGEYNQLMSFALSHSICGGGGDGDEYMGILFCRQQGKTRGKTAVTDSAHKYSQGLGWGLGRGWSMIQITSAYLLH